jgi:hypothetical protein
MVKKIKINISIIQFFFHLNFKTLNVYFQYYIIIFISLTIVPKILFNISFFIIIILTRIEKKSIKTIIKIAGGTILKVDALHPWVFRMLEFSFLTFKIKCLLSSHFNFKVKFIKRQINIVVHTPVLRRFFLVLVTTCLSFYTLVLNLYWLVNKMNWIYFFSKKEAKT